MHKDAFPQPKTIGKRTPLWTPADGITFSLLSKFIICRHRFWIRTVLGFRERSGFSHYTGYGDLFHAALEAYARHQKQKPEQRLKLALDGVHSYAESLLHKFPESATEIMFWKSICNSQFRQYVRKWSSEDQSRRYILQEAPFDLTLSLPSGRLIRLRGKFDEVFYAVKTRKVKGQTRESLTCKLQENKSKGDVNKEGIDSMLHGDLQTMFYLTALNHIVFNDGEKPDPGVVAALRQNKPPTCYHVVYNVIQRPQGQKYPPCRQKKNENEMEFAHRIGEHVQEHPDDYFHRGYVELAPEDLTRFQQRSLFPYLEQLLDWWESIQSNPFDPWNTPSTYKLDKKDNSHPSKFKSNPLHYCRPYGVYDGLAQGYTGDYHQFISSGDVNKTGLEKMTTAFPELDNPSLSGV